MRYLKTYENKINAKLIDYKDKFVTNDLEFLYFDCKDRVIVRRKRFTSIANIIEMTDTYILLKNKTGAQWTNIGFNNKDAEENGFIKFNKDDDIIEQIKMMRESKDIGLL